jgi:hypothetical protein
MKSKTSYIVLLLLCEALIIGLYHFAPCYSFLTGRPNFFHVWMQECNLLWFSIMGVMYVLNSIFERKNKF